MSIVFSQAALDRIAECASSATAGSEMSPATAILKQYLSKEVHHGLADTDFPDLADLAFDEAYGDFGPTALERANALYRFIGLLELAVTVGYVDLKAWDEIDLLKEAIRKFTDAESASDNPTDLTLVGALAERLERQEWNVATRDDKAFFAFASLLHLTVCIRDDREALEFLYQSTRGWSELGDLPFLLTPAHFAEALTFATISGLESRAVTRGLAAIHYLKWLAEIAERVNDRTQLSENFVRQARWSHHVSSVDTRISFWARRMSEWAPSGVDPEGLEAWMRFREAVFAPLKRHVTRVRPTMAPKPMQDLRTELISPGAIDEFLAEGRIGAARKVARQYAEWCAERLTAAKTDEGLSETGDALTEACIRLADIGEIDAAGVIVAPLLNKLSDWNRERARTILRRIQSANWTIPFAAPEHQLKAEDIASQIQPPNHLSLESGEGS